MTNMKGVVGIVLLFLAAAHGRALTEVCDGENCGPRTPPYEVNSTFRATEVRIYENATWAVSYGKSIFGIDVAAALATKGIFAYFAGLNNEHKKIPPSVPLITTLAHPPHPPHHGPHPHPPNSSHPHPPHNGSHPHPPHPPPPGGPIVLVGAYVPLKGDLPVPDCKQVKLVKTNTTTVYVHQFGGFAISWLVKREIDHLKVDLKALGLKPCKGKFFVATYDGPWKLIGRKNEIWWTEVPHHHHNETQQDEATEMALSEASIPMGFGAFEALTLFPEELPPISVEPEVPEQVMAPLEDEGDLMASQVQTDEVVQTA